MNIIKRIYNNFRWKKRNLRYRTIEDFVNDSVDFRRDGTYHDNEFKLSIHWQIYNDLCYVERIFQDKMVCQFHISDNLSQQILNSLCLEYMREKKINQII